MTQQKRKTKKTQTKNQPKSSKPQQDFWKNKSFLVLLIPIILVLGIFAYNKYLDWQNVEDMKQLLADFEQLERDIETETGEEFTIEAHCGSGGEKFSTNYSCSVRLYPELLPTKKVHEDLFISLASKELTSSENCNLLKGLGFSGTEEYGNFYMCIESFRSSNKYFVEDLFLKYSQS